MTLTYRGTQQTEGVSTSDTVTYSSVSIGTASSDRWVVVGVHTETGQLNSVTIGGSAATLVDSHTGLRAYARLVTSGTTATIEGTASTNIDWVDIAVWTWVGALNTTAEYDYGSGSSGGSSASCTLDVPTGGFALVFGEGRGSGSITSTGHTERWDLEVTTGSTTRTSGGDDTTAGVGRSYTIDTTSPGFDYIKAFSFGPDQFVTPALYTNSNTIQTNTVAVADWPVTVGLLTNSNTIPTAAIDEASIIIPSADNTDGGWRTEAASAVDIYASLADETNTLYIESDTAPSADTCIVELSDPTYGMNETFYVCYRYRHTGLSAETLKLTVTLKELTTTIATWTHTDVSDTWTEVLSSLTGGEYASIGNFNDLRLEFKGDSFV